MCIIGLKKMQQTCKLIGAQILFIRGFQCKSRGNWVYRYAEGVTKQGFQKYLFNSVYKFE